MNITTINVIAIITAMVIAATSIIMTTLPAAAQQSTINIIKDGTTLMSYLVPHPVLAALIQLIELLEKEVP